MTLAKIMKYIVTLFAIFVFNSCKESSEDHTTLQEAKVPTEKSLSLTDDYIEGKWQVKSTPVEVGNGMIFAEEGIVTFLPSGKFSSNTSLRCYSKETKEDIFTYSGIDTGAWRLDGGKLILNFTSMEIDNLSSKIYMITKSFLEDELKDNLGKDESNRVSSFGEDTMELIEEEEGEVDVIYHYNRIKG